ncbi:MAG TPA: hypothetical protein VD862_03115 [Candidatus Paceibacterota bacterium]|nr:hypothetical protein [Candidatus Paceibacterota bacterium]
MSVFLMLALLTGSVGAADIPDTQDWRVTVTKQLEFRVDDYCTAFVGTVTEYQNPDAPDEYVRTLARQVPVISCRSRNQGRSGIRTVSDLSWHRKDEQDALDRAHTGADAFAYIAWRTVRDGRSGEHILAEPLRVWLLDQSGVWVFRQGHRIASRPFSEPSKADMAGRRELPAPVLVGIEYSLNGEATHILRLDQDMLAAPRKTEDDDAR